MADTDGTSGSSQSNSCENDCTSDESSYEGCDYESQTEDFGTQPYKFELVIFGPDEAELDAVGRRSYEMDDGEIGRLQNVEW